MARCWSAGSPRTISPPTAPQPKPSTDSRIPLRPNARSCIAQAPGTAALNPPPPMCYHMCGGSHMATNLSIDPDLLECALEVGGERTKKATVTKALQEFIARRRQKRLLELIGKLEWDQSFDYKAERARK